VQKKGCARRLSGLVLVLVMVDSIDIGVVRPSGFQARGHLGLCPG